MLSSSDCSPPFFLLIVSLFQLILELKETILTHIFNNSVFSILVNTEDFDHMRPDVHLIMRAIAYILWYAAGHLSKFSWLGCRTTIQPSQLNTDMHPVTYHKVCDGMHVITIHLYNRYSLMMAIVIYNFMSSSC